MQSVQGQAGVYLHECLCCNSWVPTHMTWQGVHRSQPCTAVLRLFRSADNEQGTALKVAVEAFA